MQHFTQKTVYLSMASLDEESVCSTERLLKEEYSSNHLEDEQRRSRVSPRNGLWARIWQHRLSFLFHLVIITAYTAAFALMLEHIAKNYEHGPDLVHCELTYRPSYVVEF